MRPVASEAVAALTALSVASVALATAVEVSDSLAATLSATISTAPGPPAAGAGDGRAAGPGGK